MRIMALPINFGAGLLTASLLFASPAASQSFPEEFSEIRSLRELSDGRTLAFDGKENRLMLLDWDAGTSRTISRVGNGPGEYRSVSQLLSMPGDTTALVDGTARRWVLMHRDRIVGTLPQEQSLHLMQFFSRMLGADGAGRVLVVASIPWSGTGERAVLSRMPQNAESLLVLRLRRDSGRIDTLAGLRGRPWGATTFTHGSGRTAVTYQATNPLSAPEQALMLDDGTVVIARQHPFRLEIIAPNGSRRLGPILDSARVRTSPAERRAAIARKWAFAGPPLPEEARFQGWPDLVPAFPVDALLPVPGNRLAVRRQQTVAFPLERIDILDAGGQRLRQVQLAAGESLVAVGRRHVYLTRTDEDGLTILMRREW